MNNAEYEDPDKVIELLHSELNKDSEEEQDEIKEKV